MPKDNHERHAEIRHNGVSIRVTGTEDMSVMSQNVWQAKPGRFMDTMAAFAAARTIHQKHGAVVTVGAAMIAGPGSGNLIYNMHFATAREFGACFDAMMTDQDWQNLYASLDTPDSPLVRVRASSYSDFIGFERPVPTDTSKSTVYFVSQTQPRTDQVEHLMGLLPATKALAESVGLGMRAGAVYLNGGPSTWSTVFYGELGAGMADMMEKLDALTKSPKYVHLVHEMGMIGVTPTTSGLGRSLPF